VHNRLRELIFRSKLHAPDDGVLIAVEDSGTGLEAGASDSILIQCSSPKSGGMGMGLSISRSIIAAHESRIWASPGESVGAIFQIVLPSEPSIRGEQGR
jgi:K+-sensing histidine kinase KdpD